MTSAIFAAILTLAQVHKLECDPTHAHRCWADMPAIHGVGVERFGDDWASGILRYSRLRKRTHARARAIRALHPASMLPTRREQYSWHHALWLARRVVAGAVRTPCPGANHWGGAMDTAPASWARVRCSTATGNRFYRVGGES